MIFFRKYNVNQTNCSYTHGSTYLFKTNVYKKKEKHVHMYPFIDTMYVNEQIYIHAQYKEHLSKYTSYAVCVFSSTGS